MKIAFSTLACPTMSWPDIYAMAKDIGFDGIEMRGIGANIFAINGSPFADAKSPTGFDEEKIEAAIDKLKSLRVSMSCFSTDCCLKFKEKREENFTNLVAYIKMAKRFGTPYLRILADLDVRPDGEVDDAFIVEQLKALAPVAEENGVSLLVETNGVYADTERLRKLLTETASDAVAALWDIHHPYRVKGESPEKTVQNLGAFIRYIHAKDSVMENGKIVYKLMGEGDLPVKEMMLALRSINYDGYVSLEWVKRWATDLQEADIVFPHFVEYMQPYLEGRSGKGKLYENNAKTGYFIWEKETLIDLTFPQLLDRIAEEFPDQPAFKYADATKVDYARTYREFRGEVDVFARALIAMGVKRGDKVSIWATNVPEWFISFWATTKIGAILVTVNTAYKVHEAEFLLRQSDTHTLIMIEGHKDSNYSAIVRELCPELAARAEGETLHAKRLPFLRNVITVGFDIPGAVTWAQAMAKAEQTPYVEVYQRMAMINVHDVCNMQYTSGTTGFPKGVMLTHYNVVNNGKNIGDRMDLSTADRMMIHVPMFHCFGMVLAMTACVTHGVTLCPVPAFSPRVSLDCVTKEKITAFHGVPTMFIAMLEHPDFPASDFSHVRTGIMAGSPCPVKVMRDVLEQMNMTEITIVYGQTESAPGCTMSRSDDSIEVKVNTVGGALPGIECKVVDPNTGEDLPDDTDGEFVARGYNIMKGYYKMPEATANVIDADGWLHTGDLARRMPDGNYKITGRIKDMIIRGGENIYPKEIEDFIYTHELVRDVQVVGVPDVQYGEEILACVILKEGAELSEEGVKDFVRTHMAKHKTPRYVRFVNDFPMNAAGKILKYKIVESAVEWLGLSKED